MTALVIRGGVVVTAHSEPEVVADGAVAVVGDRIAAVGPRAEVDARFPDAEVVDAGGGVIVPGFVNLHHHFYSALARGLDPGVAMPSFSDILSGLWWRLDRALDRAAVGVSAALTLADCVRSGCTTVVDHHASPSFIAGSLDVIATEVERAGLRAALCYEVSDRNGAGEAAAGLEETLDFAARHRAHPRLRGLLGLHASFTLSDATLAAAGQRRPAGCGVHVHLAEDRVDVATSLERYGTRPLARLLAAGLVDEHALLVHGIHLAADELAAIAASGATLVHNPESNQNNGVGRLDLVDAAAAGCRLGLGTDGMASSMPLALRSAFLGLRGGRRDPTLGFAVVPELLAVNARVAGAMFGEPRLGHLEAGAPADVVVLDSPSPTPLTAANWFGHLVYGLSLAPVRHTIAGGRVVLRDFHPTGIDVTALAARARELAPAVWQRFAALA